ncbi:hypothetical protein RMR10_009655 [Agrobacterium rosae]|uniref:hypothetical protein n=1 Tax=Agrobacterium rosae TaxID=1972867 RepID=UPI002A12C5AE|nr:hypothetical protein [Agrobacterium rosae]MDX8315829.1 hypothetical protein [Agrobacterium rosae]
MTKITPPYKIRLWAIVGPHNSGKSSLIGALTSEKRCSGHGRDVLLRGNGWLHIHAYSQSVQEGDYTEASSIKRIEDAAAASHARHPIAYFNVLLALRSDVYKGLNQGYKYLAAYTAAGWDIESIIMLDIPDQYNDYGRMGAPTAIINESTANSAIDLQRNWVFAEARNHFGWA